MHRTLVASCLALFAPVVQAQDAYPSKPISMIAPFPPGGVADIVGRPLAAAMGQIKGGKMRALAGWGDKRLPMMPELPTFKELGYKDVEFYIWSGVFVPAATPAPIQARLRDAVRAAVADPQFRGTMEKVQTPISYLDTPDFRVFLATDAARLKVAVEKIGKVAEK